MKLKALLHMLPDHPALNAIIVYATSVYFHKSFFFYFSNTLNGYMLREKPSSGSLSRYVDKLTAKDYIKSKVCSAHVIENIAVYNGSVPDDTEWAFKCNNDFSGALLYSEGKLIDVKKSTYQEPFEVNSKQELAKYIRCYMQGNSEASPFGITREGCYKGIEKRYFFEEFISQRDGDDAPVNEYKFHCLNGRVEFVYLVHDRAGANKRVVLGRDKFRLPFTWCKSRDLAKFSADSESIKISDNFELMCELAETLAEKFVYVRVDIYDTTPHPKVGELTFFHGSGLEPITPKAYDYEYGAKLQR